MSEHVIYIDSYWKFLFFAERVICPSTRSGLFIEINVLTIFQGFAQANTMVGQDGITIHNFAISNDGVYRCKATNALGATTKIFEIHGS